MRLERCADYDELHRFLLNFGEDEIPDPRVTVDVVRNGTGIVAASMSQSVIHFGPTYVLPSYLQTSAGMLLVKHAIQSSGDTEIHVLSMNPETDAQCHRMGMTRYDGNLWIR